MSKSNLIPFTFKDHQVRTYINGDIWFCAKDVCDILGYKNSRQVIQKNCRDRGVSIRYTPTSSGDQEMAYIDEGNLYRLIIKSRKPESKPFESWVCDEVLPSIRKTGSYFSPTNIITDEQAAMLKDAIWERKHAGKNPIWRYWNIFKNQFHLTEYKNLPADRFEEAMEFIQNMPESRIRQNSQQHIDFMVKCAINTLQKYRSDILDVDSNNNTQTIECGRNFQNVIRDLFESNNKAKLELKKILQQIEKYVHYMDAVNKNSERGDELYHDLIIATTKKLDEAYAFAGPQSGKLIFINDLDNAELQKHGGNL